MRIDEAPYKPSLNSRSRLNFGIKFMVICLTVMLVHAQKASAIAGYFINVTAVFTGNNLTSLTAGSIFTRQGPNPVNGPAPMTFQFETGAGAAIGGLINANLPNVLAPPAAIPFPAIPGGAAPLGNKLVLTYDDGAQLNTWNLNWALCGIYGFRSPGIFGDPTGAPGITPQQSWNFTSTSGPLYVGPMSNPGISYAVSSDNIDLSYTDMGGGLYQATIVGNNSYFDLADPNSDVNQLLFSAGTVFGTLQYNPGSTTQGTVDFSAMGLTGTFTYDSSTDSTTINSTSLSTFDTIQFTAASVPEPSTLALAGLSGLIANLFLRRRGSASGR
jgi:hypothetical protein